MRTRRVSPFLPVLLLLSMVSGARAVSSYTCTTFPVGMGMRFAPTVIPSSINNQVQVAGLWNVQFFLLSSRATRPDLWWIAKA